MWSSLEARLEGCLSALFSVEKNSTNLSICSNVQSLNRDRLLWRDDTVSIYAGEGVLCCLSFNFCLHLVLSCNSTCFEASFLMYSRLISYCHSHNYTQNLICVVFVHLFKFQYRQCPL